MRDDSTTEFVVEDVSLGPFANGFGLAEDGRPYTFRVVGRSLMVELYRIDANSPVPGEEDVVARAQTSTAELDLCDQRSVTGAVRDLVARAAGSPASDDDARGVVDVVRDLVAIPVAALAPVVETVPVLGRIGAVGR